jgi:hypothetical protein
MVMAATLFVRMSSAGMALFSPVLASSASLLEATRLLQMGVFALRERAACLIALATATVTMIVMMIMCARTTCA